MIVVHSPGLIRRDRPGLVRSVGASRFGRVLDRPRRVETASAPTFHEQIVKAGMTANLLLCLDAGDPLSYKSNQADPQKWLDRSGNGTDFYRGADGTAASDDPTWNGKGWWDFDGGDHFQIVGGNPARIDALHKAGAKYTIVCWGYPVSDGTIFALTTATAAAEVGLIFYTQGLIVRAGGSTALLKLLDATPSNDQWHFAAVSVDEAGGATAGFVAVDGAYSPSGGANTWNPAYSAPSAAAATYAARIGCHANLSAFQAAGSRTAVVAVWEGTAHAKDALDTLFNLTRATYGV
jgi:hypothetical protein